MQNSQTEIASDLNNWEYFPLGSLVVKRKGKKPNDLTDKKTPNSLPYIDIEAFEHGVIKRYTSDKTAPVSTEKDVLVVWDGARCGLAGIAKGAIGSTLMKLTPKNIESEYLLLFLQSKYKEINNNPRGTGIPHVEPDFFWNLEVPVPSEVTRKAIINKHAKLNPSVQKIRDDISRARLLIQKFRQAVLSAAVTGKLTEGWRGKHQEITSSDLYNELTLLKKKGTKYINLIEEDELPIIPESWRYVRLDNLTSGFKYGTSEKSGYSLKGTPVLRIPNVISQKIDTDDIKYLPHKIHDENLLVKPGDILIVRSNGSRDLVGKNALVRRLEQSYSFASYLIRITPHKVVPEFVSILLNCLLVKRQLFNQAKSAAGINNINSKELASITVPLPPIEEQIEIVKTVTSFFDLSTKIEQEIENASTRINKLSRSILAKAFRGELIN